MSDHSDHRLDPPRIRRLEGGGFLLVGDTGRVLDLRELYLMWRDATDHLLGAVIPAVYGKPRE